MHAKAADLLGPSQACAAPRLPLKLLEDSEGQTVPSEAVRRPGSSRVPLWMGVFQGTWSLTSGQNTHLQILPSLPGSLPLTIQQTPSKVCEVRGARKK